MAFPARKTMQFQAAKKPACGVADRGRRSERLPRGPSRRFVSWQQIVVARPVFGCRTLKRPKRRRPQFHAIQIIVQAVEGLDQIADD
jgi:hypothetical protein